MLFFLMIFSQCLCNKAAMNIRNAEANNALMCAVLGAHARVVKLLVERGIEVRAKNKYGVAAIRII